MLLEFKVKNWLSFNNEVNFTMMATRERDPNERLAVDNAFTGRVLPITAIYGYNASGKTNFIEAILFLQNLVLHKRRLINLQPFAFLNTNYKESWFYVKFFSNSKVYEYEIKLDLEKILYEKLSIVGKTTSSILFERIINSPLKLHSKFTPEQQNRLQIILQGTAISQTFLNNTFSQQFNLFRDAFEWFSLKLVIVKPYTQYFVPNSPMYSYHEFNNILEKLDIKNNEYVSNPVRVESLGLLPQDISNLNVRLKEGQTQSIFPSITVTKINNQLQFSSVAVRHKNLDNHDVTTDLDLSSESDGVKRLYELRPVLKDLLLNNNAEYTFVIDELDRSLHPLLVRHLIELFNQCCTKDIRRQLIFTCHDISLLDQDLLRRDSYWIITKNYYGESRMQRITNLKQGKRTDKSIRNAYMAGELGVSPEFLN
ncbi:AAA family ATPase [Succinivibrio dextrinosolvens]|uniref:AAA family ATPase n=1 Tax=Succinivibrio dextrinosolvens TaxID=83771 RepID=UPI001921CC1A|nr:ATP-binding protein [Succinivibrio dextrinosolvens]